MFKYLSILFVLFSFLNLNAQVNNEKNKTANQLGGIVSGVTVPNKSFFDDQIFQRFVNLVIATMARGITPADYDGSINDAWQAASDSSAFLLVPSDYTTDSTVVWVTGKAPIIDLRAFPTGKVVLPRLMANYDNSNASFTNPLMLRWTGSGDDDTTYFAFGKNGFLDIGADPGLTLKRNNKTTRMAFNWATKDSVWFITGFDAPLTNDLVLAYAPHVVHSLGTGGDNLRISPTTNRINISPNAGTPTVDSTGAQLQVRPDSTNGHVVSGMTVYLGTGTQAGTGYTWGVAVNADSADSFKITDLSNGATNWLNFSQGNQTTDWRIGREVDASNNFHLETYHAAGSASDANTPGRRQQRLWNTGEVTSYGPQGGFIATDTDINLQTGTNAVTADWDTAAIAILTYATAFAPGPALYMRASDGDALNLAIATDDHLYFQNASGHIFDENVDISDPTTYGLKVNTTGSIDGILLDKAADDDRNFVAWQQGTGAWRAGVGATPYELSFKWGASSPTPASPGNERFAFTPSNGLRIANDGDSANISLVNDSLTFSDAVAFHFSGGGVIVGAPTGGNKGAGTINAENVYDDNVLLTDFVFEKDYNLIPIDSMKSFFEKEKHLPTIPGREEWEKEGRFPLGKIVNHLWETVEVQARYISELNERIAALENSLDKKVILQPRNPWGVSEKKHLPDKLK